MVFPEIGNGQSDGLSMQSGESRTVVFLSHDSVRKEGLNYSAIFRAKSVFLRPRARGSSDSRVGWMANPKPAGQELGAEEVKFGCNREDLSLLVEVPPPGCRMATGDDTEGRTLDALETENRRCTGVRGPNRGSVGEERFEILFVSQGEGFFAATPRRASQDAQSLESSFSSLDGVQGLSAEAEVRVEGDTEQARLFVERDDGETALTVG